MISWNTLCYDLFADNHDVLMQGSYLLASAAPPRAPGDVARFNSERLTPTAGLGCLRFYYHMYGSGMGTLRVRINHGIPGTHDIEEDAKEFSIWELSGDQGNEWKAARVRLINKLISTHLQYCSFHKSLSYRPAGVVVTTSLSVLEVWGSIGRPVGSDTMSSTARHRCVVSSEFEEIGLPKR